jgi:hypothetical protein
MVIRIGDRVKCKDGVIGKVTNFHKDGKDYHIVIKTEDNSTRDLKLSEYLIIWVDQEYDLTV